MPIMPVTQAMTIKNGEIKLMNLIFHYQHISGVFRKSRRGGGARARRAPLHPRRAPYGRETKSPDNQCMLISTATAAREISLFYGNQRRSRDIGISHEI